MNNIKKITIYFICCTSLFLGLLFDENSSGGAKIDHTYLIPFIENFSINFKNGFQLFIGQSLTLIHSPVFYLITGFFLKITQNILVVKILYLLLSCSIPYIFFLIIKTKYEIKTDYLFYFSLLFFLSPYFRSSAIWLLGDNLSLIFFSLSVLFFLEINFNKDKIINYYLCFTFLILCSYIRYYYCIFSIYYLIYFYRNLTLKDFFKILIFSFFLSIPAFYYLFYIATQFNFFGAISTFGTLNYYTNALIIVSIFLFYLFPFILKDSFLIFDFYKKKYKNILLIFLIFLIIYLIDKFYFPNIINFSTRGGGIFVKISDMFNLDKSLFLSLIAFIGLIVIDYLFKDNRFENYTLLIILILCFPLFSFFQKYLDPLYYFFFFCLIKSNYLKQTFLNETISLKLVYLYHTSFFLFSLIYYYKVVQ